MTQLSFVSLDHQHKKKRMKREVFLAEMEAVVSCDTQRRKQANSSDCVSNAYGECHGAKV